MNTKRAFNILLDYLETYPYSCGTTELYSNRIINWNKFFLDVFDINNHYFKSGNGNRGGVYLIDDIYVGESFNIRSRLKNHIQDCINGRHTNLVLRNHVCDKLAKGEKIKFKILSGERRDEERICLDLISKGYRLCNNLSRLIKHKEDIVFCPKCKRETIKRQDFYACNYCNKKFNITITPLR